MEKLRKKKMAAKKITKTERQLTITSRYRTRSYYQSVVVPEIRLVGKWLRESGFEEGKRIKVQVENNALTITLNEE